MKPPYPQLAQLFKSLAHPTRLQILDLLRNGEICVCHIERALSKRQAYVSQQLMLLREDGLVDTRKEGLQVYYRLANPFVEQLFDIALGITPPNSFQRIDDCPCPACVTASRPHIQPTQQQ